MDNNQTSNVNVNMPVNNAPANSAPASSSGTASNQQSSPGNKWMVVVGIVIIVLIIFGVAFYYLINSQNSISTNKIEGNNATILEPGSDTSSTSFTAAEEESLNSLTAEDIDNEFNEIDQDINSL